MTDPPRPLTPPQLAVYRLCLRGLESGRGVPTYRSIAAAFGWQSINTARTHIVALARHGLVRLPGPHGRVSLPGVRVRLEFEDTEVGRLARAAFEGEGTS
jgi:hypothetical protein